MRELHRREFEARPGMYSQVVSNNIARARNVPWADPEKQASAQEFFAEMVPYHPERKILTYLSFGIARAFDQSRSGQQVHTQDTLARLLVAAEQMARDDGNTRMAWLLTHLPDPPWARLLTHTADGQTADFALLSDPSWVAASIAYIKDAASINEHKKDKALREPKTPKEPKVPKRPKGAKGAGGE